MTYEAALDKIHERKKFGSKPGLDRIRALLSGVSNPEDRLRFIHVAGTNGKGSCCAITASSLSSCGYKTGLYTSPYVIDFRERISVNGWMIQKNELAECAQIVFKAEEARCAGDPATEFEIVTAIAFLYFERRRCDFVVLETGLGGRFDATNVIERPITAAITAIDFDHTDVLGDTIEKIAFEKSGIIKSGCEVVSYCPQRPEALEVIKRTAEEKGCSLSIVDDSRLEYVGGDRRETRFKYKDRLYRVPLAGRHQMYNAALALEILESLRRQDNDIPEVGEYFGVGYTNFPARFELLHEEPPVILDGAHNISGIKALSAAVKELVGESYKLTVMMGMLKDKDYKSCIEEIASLCGCFIAVEMDNPRSLDAQTAAETAGQVCPNSICYEDIDQAVEYALSCHKSGDALLVCGSLYLAGEVRTKIISGLNI